MEKSIIRTDRAGVFYGTVTNKAATPAGLIVTIKDCIRLWYWSGACSLSQLAVDGTKNPNSCKFAVPLESIEVAGVIEIIPCTEKACDSIEAVASWKL